MTKPRLQRAIVRSMMLLPAGLLRLMSGGRRDAQDGRKLDARFQFLSHMSRRSPPLSSMTPAKARTVAARGVAIVAGRGESGVRFKRFTIDAPQGALSARVYRPEALDARTPVLVYFHGGGGVVGDLDSSHALCTMLAKIGRCSVLSIDYRLAPEHPFPAAVEDALFCARWARANAARFGAAAGRIAVGGDSFGASLAAVVAQTFKREGEPQPQLQLLIYPVVDPDSRTQSMSTFAQAYPLSRDTMDWFKAHYFGPGVEADDAWASPLHADLAHLADAIVVTAGFDPLVDQGEAYAHRLLEAGVPTIYRCYDSLPHGFVYFTGAIPAADIACREIAGLFRQGLEGKIAAAAAIRIDGDSAFHTVGLED